VTGDEHRVVAHGPQALGDAAGKQYVTYKSAFQLWRIKHHMARGVARAVAHLQAVRAQLLACALQHVKVTTGVDDGGGHALVFSDHSAVLLKRRDGDGFVVKHKKVLTRIAEIINGPHIHQTDIKLY
jgi:hypothetical protein